MRSLVSTLALATLATAAGAEPMVLDDFADAGRWTVVKTEGVELTLSAVPGTKGDATRLDYDFTKGAGYCIIRREFDLPLPANYRFDIDVRGAGPANNLEFKLVSLSGDDVWWVNRRAFEPPAEWTHLRDRKRHFEFAWGPSGGAPLAKVGAIEFAISANEGGKGHIDLDELTFEPLPDVDTTPAGGQYSIGTGDNGRPLGAIGPDGTIPWGGTPASVLNNAEWVELSFGHPVEFGAVEIDWGDANGAPPYEIQFSDDGRSFRTVRDLERGRGGTHAFYRPESEAEAVRLVTHAGFAAQRPTRLRLAPIGEVPDANAFWSARAEASRRGLYPAYFLGERDAWTVVGLPDDDNEALISEYGAIEPFKGGGSVEPFLHVGDRLVTWADAEISHTLGGGFLPIPTVTWEASDARLDVTALATGEAGRSRLLIRYRVSNTGEKAQQIVLELTARPFQVLPSSQRLNIVGGKAHHAGAILPVGDDTPAVDESVADALERVGDPDGPVSAWATFPLAIAPGRSSEIVLSLPLHEEGDSPTIATPAEFDAALNAERDRWSALLGSPGLVLPDAQQDLIDTYRAAIADILINADGPAIQPGSRTYERSWIRDGAVSSLALIHAGLADRARDFVNWYAGYQFDSGKVPCVVDRRGPDPVDENDSNGEFLFSLRNASLATTDAASANNLLQRHYQEVRKAVSYMQSIREKRLSDADGLDPDPIRQATVGLLQKSISHEGYSAKPMHSYWDDFWALRGFEDAADIARRLGEQRDERQWTGYARGFRDDLYDSIRFAAGMHHIDYVPGCAELGDFDATSTSIAIFPVGELGRAPEPLLTNTFEKYWDFFVKRRDGVEPWDGMTPYECRIVGSLVRLGWADRAHAVLGWLLDRRSPEGWEQWGEIAYADPDTDRYVGDMPHTWVASGYALSLLSMFAYERGDEIVLAPAMPRDWIFSSTGVGVDRFWTPWGPLSYRFAGQGSTAVLELHDVPDAPGGFSLRIPGGQVDEVLVDGTPRRPQDGFIHLAAEDRIVTIRYR
ncbi:MAG: discoidin domain-containing protein [Phycisphaeraceae bacterium]|nr:MAG: discoidin domain-containing protein [Phycisphaeraceae bacterium]